MVRFFFPFASSEMKSHCTAQTSLKLLGTTDPPTQDSPKPGIKACHHMRLRNLWGILSLLLGLFEAGCPLVVQASLETFLYPLPPRQVGDLTAALSSTFKCKNPGQCTQLVRSSIHWTPLFRDVLPTCQEAT